LCSIWNNNAFSYNGKNIYLGKKTGETANIEDWRSKRSLELDRVVLLKKALVVVAFSFLLYTLYQAITTTIFVSHFPTVIIQLPRFIKSSQPNL
jgi:hypothetical protein